MTTSTSSRRLPIALAAAALFFCSAAPAIAQAPTPDSGGLPTAAEEAASMAAVQRWLSDAAGWGRQIQALVEDNAVTMTTMMEGLEKAADYAERRDRKGGKTWAAQWAPEQRARLAKLKAAAASVPQPPAAPAELSADPSMRSRLQALSDAAGAVSSLLMNTATAGEGYVGLIEKAAGGSRDALAELAPVTVDTVVAALRGENSISGLSGALADPGHPQRDLFDCSVSLNLALIEVFEYQRAGFGGVKADGADFATRIDRHADAAIASANDVAPHVERLKAQIEAAPPSARAVLDRFTQVLPSFADSAAVELEIAAGLKKVAAEIRNGAALDSPAITQALANFETLAQRRAQLIDHRRQALITNS